MFANRSTEFSSHTTRNRGTLSSVPSNNENAVLNSKQTANKTPAASSRSRRAFGDISNKKAPLASNGGSKETVVLKPRNSGITTTRKQQSLIPNLSSTIPSKTRSQSKLPRRTINFPLPRTQLKLPEAATITKSSSITQSLGSPVDPVERPSGRTWLQQLENGDHDDDWSATSSVDEDFKRAMWEDWGESLRETHEEEKAKREQLEDFEFQEHINRVMKEQEQGEFTTSRIDHNEQC